jgi:hypothetical protein
MDNTFLGCAIAETMDVIDNAHPHQKLVLKHKKRSVTHKTRRGLVKIQNRVHSHDLQSDIHPLALPPRNSPLDDTSYQRMLHPREVKVINDLQSKHY